MALQRDYAERVYAGMLGKVIGVYLGRPFEGWSHHAIMKRLGPIRNYVHDKVGVPLIVADDDISGTITFLRAFEDSGRLGDVTPQDIGEGWLNYLIENRTILWWGGNGNSTEHTAYLRLKSGIRAPQSGSAALNGKVVSEQIGSQIFIDGWALICPGDPEKAADFARRAASVSHDGEAIYGAQMIAAMEAEAFVSSDVDHLIDTALKFIPEDSIIARMIGELRALHAKETDWLKARAWIERDYGYDTYGGNCHMIPNHALIILALLYADNDFPRAMEIVNTAGWDTDCNSGNIGCLMGIMLGLEGLDPQGEDGTDWRGPVADRIFLSSADAGRATTDVLEETIRIVNMGQRLAGENLMVPDGGARFNFALPGAVQGFQSVDNGKAATTNVASALADEGRALSIRLLGPGQGAAETPLFLAPHGEGPSTHGAYDYMGTPLLNPGQTLRARVMAPVENKEGIKVTLYLKVYGSDEKLTLITGPEQVLKPGVSAVLEWLVPGNEGRPIGRLGLGADGATGDAALLDWARWEGAPQVTLTRTRLPEGAKARSPERKTDGWRRAWVNGVDTWEHWYPEPFRLIQNTGCGLLMYGTRDWTDYAVEADVTPHMAMGAGMAARVQGMRRYYALVLRPGGKLELVKCLGGTQVLASCDLDWEFGDTLDLRIEVEGSNIRGYVGGTLKLEAEDETFTDGGIALLCEEGRMATQQVVVRPLTD
jgi:ADP-ribosylglycohydrolase